MSDSVLIPNRQLFSIPSTFVNPTKLEASLNTIFIYFLKGYSNVVNTIFYQNLIGGNRDSLLGRQLKFLPKSL